jgi:hypothetical protein
MSTVETLAAAPAALRALADDLERRGAAGALSTEFVYHPGGPHSFYRDLATYHGLLLAPGALGRLERHAEQMLHLARDRQSAAERSLRAGGVEFRVEPNRNDGQGGYFSPPAWLNELFATANRPGRVLSGLMRRFDLPMGVSSVNLPIVTTGTGAAPALDTTSVDDVDLVDSSGTSAVVAVSGTEDVALQLLELSPAAAALDWAIFTDLSEATTYDLEQQLLFGSDGNTATTVAQAQLPGILSLSGTNAATYTAGSPTGTGLFPILGQAFAHVGNQRLRPPECWLMRSARWAWLMTSEDSTNQRPYGLDTRFYLGADDDTPDPVSGLLGIPVFLTDAIPMVMSGNPGSLTFTGGTQDAIVCSRPTDQVLFEGAPSTLIAREPLSGAMGVRLQMHTNVAAITGRRPAGISVVSGTGLVVQSGFTS